MKRLKLLDCNKISSSELEADVKQDFVPTKVRWKKKFKKIIAHNLWLTVTHGTYTAKLVGHVLKYLIKIVCD